MGNGNYWVYFRAVNGAGLASEVKGHHVLIDKTAPSITGLSGRLSNQRFSMTVSTGDNLSGIQFAASNWENIIGFNSSASRIWARDVDGVARTRRSMDWRCYYYECL